MIFIGIGNGDGKQFLEVDDENQTMSIRDGTTVILLSNPPGLADVLIDRLARWTDQDAP